jgi:hypothetical protein
MPFVRQSLTYLLSRIQWQIVRLAIRRLFTLSPRIVRAALCKQAWTHRPIRSSGAQNGPINEPKSGAPADWRP